MLNLIRRISHSVIPRPDRPWEDDPTSNAPHKAKKRRLSSTDRETDDEQSSKKKARGESIASSVDDATQESPLTPLPQSETQGVKEVTQGVKEVELVAPESIPLPEEEAGELDEVASAATPPETQPHQEVDTDERLIAQRGQQESTGDGLALDKQASLVEEEGRVDKAFNTVIDVDETRGAETATKDVLDAGKDRNQTKGDTSTKD